MALSNPKKIILALVLAAAVTLYFCGRSFLEKCYYPPILMYHSVDDHGFKLKLSVPVKEFRAQMKYLRDRKYDIVSSAQLADMINSGKKIPRNIVAVTFDDGYLDNYLNAFPVFKEYKIPATIFVISGSIGKPDFVNAAQMKEMSDAGIDIESHSVTHPFIEGSTKEGFEREAVESKKAIEAITGKPVYTFCFPYGGFNDYTRDILRDAGYKAGFVTMPRDNSIALDAYRLKRVKIASGPFSSLDFRLKTSGYYMWFKAHRWKKKKSTKY
ncbi:MAG: polysaccharide deacetylase family protein [Candidatus Omnitrophica bacterium]|nr:polysaccharide deacetylase family protein [Candidatus Omnitrophota bacterium]MDD5310826.1 polysaccharide deacetylase family protein [Candidatus Omnitrophota bacterium]MDD5546789.1 polysaccharide deacetylase family protein [Candidatus Omnitrophota bacterium]